MKYEKNEQTVRPFRLYNADTKKFQSHRCFKIKQNAHLGALMQIRWAKVGTTLEVVDLSIGKMHGQYTRGVNDIKFLKGEL